MKLNPVTQIIDWHHKLDPANDALIRALKCTIPGLVGALCWICIRKPLSFWIILLPVLSIYVISYASNYKQKFLYLINFLFIIIILQLGVSLLYNHSFSLISFYFIVIIFSTASFKYRYGAIMALLVTVEGVGNSMGWYAGINRNIEIFICAIISSALIIVYEYLFTIKQLKSTIIYFFELVLDSYKISAIYSPAKGEEIVKNKYLNKDEISKKIDFEIEKAYKTDREKFAHRVIMEIINKGKYIDIENYIFKKNINYHNYIFPVYITIRDMIRSITYLYNYNANSKEICRLYPTTPVLLNNINDAINSIILFFKKNRKFDYLLKKEIISEWNKEYDNICNNKENITNDEVIESIYGIKCLISDIEKIEELLLNQESL